MQNFYVGHAMRKCVIRHLRTVKTQIRLCIRAVLSGPLLSANSHLTLWNVSMESNCPDETLHMREINLNMCILHMFECTFSLDMADMKQGGRYLTEVNLWDSGALLISGKKIGAEFISAEDLVRPPNPEA